MTNCRIVEMLLTSMFLLPSSKEDIKLKRVMLHDGVSPERYNDIKNAIGLLYGEEAAVKFAYQVESYSRGFVTKMFLRQGVTPLKLMRQAIPEAYKEIQAENALLNSKAEPDAKGDDTTSYEMKVAS